MVRNPMSLLHLVAVASRFGHHAAKAPPQRRTGECERAETGFRPRYGSNQP